MKKTIVIICLMLIFSMTSSIGISQNINNNLITKYDNSPPTIPMISAPDTVVKNKVFVSRIISTDPDGDKIFYRFKMGENGTPHSWNGPFYSGYEFKLRIRILLYTGDLIFGFQAKDEYGAKSDWAYHQITYINDHCRNYMFNNFLSFLTIFFN